MSDNISPSQLQSEVRRLRAELEQANAAAEDAAEEAARAAREIRLLQAELRERDEIRGVAERAVRHLREQLAASADCLVTLRVEQSRGVAADEELAVAAEELNVLVEELKSANAALREGHAGLERRVEERTAALTAANAALSEAEARLSLALRLAGAGIWDWNIATGRVVWSDECWELCGLTPGEVVPSPEAWLDGIVPEDRAEAEAALKACLAGHSAEFAVEYRILHPTRGLRWLAARGRPVHYANGRPLRLLGLSLDVTDRKQALLALDTLNRELTARVETEVAAREAVQRVLFENQKLEALGQLTGGVAHDFNNLLTVVISGLHLLEHEPADPEWRRKLLARIMRASARGADLTRRLLAFGRGQELRPVAIDLADRMGELRGLLSHSLRENIMVEAKCAPGTWPVCADAGALELALLNLAVNARDAMPHGGTLTITVTNRRVAPEETAGLGLMQGDFVELRIADTGTGMPDAVREHAFEPFFTTKEAGKGTGLGLAQVYGFTRQSGGRARIETRPGAGTTVILLLPRATEATARDGQGAWAAAAMRPVSVMVVEDNEAVAESVTDMLNGMGHRVHCADGAEAAAGVLASPAPLDLVLTDLLLPGGSSGADVVRLVRRHRPNLPVVLTTGYGGEAIADPDLAGLPMVRKPYEPTTLAATLARALARGSAGTGLAEGGRQPREAPTA